MLRRVKRQLVPGKRLVSGARQDKRGALFAKTLAKKRPENSRSLFHFSQGALHFAAAQATRAHIHTLRRSIHEHTNALGVWRPGTARFVVRMADIVAIGHALLAHLTEFSHRNTPSLQVVSHTDKAYYTTPPGQMQAVLV